MRIWDEQSDCAIRNVLVLLTREEARELAAAVSSLLESGEGAHDHVADQEPTHELTIGLYKEGVVPEGFHERMGRLILEDT